jgi:acyl-CoA synthetase (AMP-forming)/AMP-acid ligase II
MSAPDSTASPAIPLRRLVATRYVTALREGGSVPAVVEADDGALYVAKFRAAAQGGRALAAELIAGEVGRAAGLPIPELALIEVDAALGRSEPHQEIQELLIRSAGTNLAMGYLAGALGYDVAAGRPVDPALASAIVAFDLYVANVDRTARNPNLLWQGPALWLIDNGAALYWHHGWDGSLSAAELKASAERAFARAGDHVLLSLADRLPEAGAHLAAALDEARLAGIVTAVPQGWLGESGDSLRAAYLSWLQVRRAALPRIVDEANRVRATRV